MSRLSIVDTIAGVGCDVIGIGWDKSAYRTTAHRFTAFALVGRRFAGPPYRNLPSYDLFPRGQVCFTLRNSPEIASGFALIGDSTGVPAFAEAHLSHPTETAGIGRI